MTKSSWSKPVVVKPLGCITPTARKTDFENELFSHRIICTEKRVDSRSTKHADLGHVLDICFREKRSGRDSSRAFLRTRTESAFPAGDYLRFRRTPRRWAHRRSGSSGRTEAM